MTSHQYTVNEIIVDTAKKRFKEIIPRIPGNTIIHKTITGIGATTCEIEDTRDSIIVLPNVASILNKAGKTAGSFAVFERSSKTELADYLTSKLPIKKLFTTPESLRHIVKGCQMANINPYKQYFLLMDESHKYIQDNDYRPNITMAMNFFFKFEQKAMVSATPIYPSDPRFGEQGFSVVKLKPTFDYHKPVEVFFQDNHLQCLRDVIERNTEVKQCIFFNSINGIKDIIKKLYPERTDIISQTAIFCSAESAKALKAEKTYHAYNEFRSEHLKQYNFFTSSFYNALDIELTEQVQIILVTVRSDPKTYFDPHTDSVQAIGRFRQRKDKTTPVKDEVVHIIDNGATWQYKNPDQARNSLQAEKNVYDTIFNLYKSNPNYLEKDIYISTLKRLPFHNFLCDDKHLYPRLEDIVEDQTEYLKTYEIDYFKIDNYFETERVNSYYADLALLWEAYQKVGVDDVDHRPAFETFVNSRPYAAANLIENIQKLNLNGSKRYSKAKVKSIVEFLSWADSLQDTPQYDQAVDKITAKYDIVRKAYYALHAKGIKELDYSITKIKQALIDYDTRIGKNKEPVIDSVYLKFPLKVKIPISKIKTQLQGIYSHYGLQTKAKATDLTRWFTLKECKIVKYIDIKMTEKQTEDSNKETNSKQRIEERAYILLKHKYNLHPNLKRS